MSAHELLWQLFNAPFVVPDKGSGSTFAVIQDRTEFPIVTAGAEARTLAAPDRSGVMCKLVCNTHVGDATVTVLDSNGATTYTIVLTAAGAWALLHSIQVGTTYKWQALNGYSATGIGSLSTSAAALAVSNLTVATAMSAASVLATNLSVATGATIPQLVCSSGISANFLLGTSLNCNYATLGAVTQTSVAPVVGVSFASAGGTTNTAAVQLPSAPVVLLNVTSAGAFFKTPTAALGLGFGVVNTGSASGIIVGDATTRSVAYATTAGLSVSSALNLVCDGTNWLKRGT